MKLPPGEGLGEIIFYKHISKPLSRVEFSERAHYHEREFNCTKIQVAMQLYFSLYSFVSSHV